MFLINSVDGRAAISLKDNISRNIQLNTTVTEESIPHFSKYF